MYHYSRWRAPVERVFYGRVPLASATVALWAAMEFYQIPREERVMEQRMGQQYLGFKRRVPRWIGLAT